MLTITSDEIKRKCMIGISETGFDADIDALIIEMQPAIEFTIDPDFLSDTADAGLQASLRLGVLELMAAEFLAQLCRQPGYSEEFSVGGVRVGQFQQRGQELQTAGAARLGPFRKAMGASDGQSRLLSTTLHADRELTAEAARGW